MGLYELFISKLDLADGDGEEDEHAGDAKPKKKRGGFSLEHRPNWLHVESLQHLEHNTGAVVVMVMVVNIFESEFPAQLHLRNPFSVRVRMKRHNIL